MLTNPGPVGRPDQRSPECESVLARIRAGEFPAGDVEAEARFTAALCVLSLAEAVVLVAALDVWRAS